MATRYEGSEREGRALDLFIKLNRATASVGRQVHAGLREHGITDIQFGVLDTIQHLGPLPISTLADKNLCSQNSLSSVIDTMERNGLVSRQRGTEDRRVVQVDLTESGRNLYREIWPDHLGRIVAASDGLSLEEIATLDALLRRLGLQTA